MIVPINARREKSGLKTICMTHPRQNNTELFLMCYVDEEALQDLFEEGYIVGTKQVSIWDWPAYVESVNAKS